MTTTRRSERKTKIVTAAIAALMVTTTAASFTASADNIPALDQTAQSRTAVDENAAERFVRQQLDGTSYSDVLDVWKKVEKGTDSFFPQGCDIDGDGIETEEEINEVGKKVQEYAAGMTVGLMKMGLNACCDGLADCFEGPLNDFANMMMGVPGEASNDDIMDKIDRSTKQVIDRIGDAENNIADKVNDLNVAGSHGANIDNYESAAKNSRESIKVALKAKTNEEKTVEVASALGDLGKWSSHDIVKERGRARDSFLSDFSAKDFNNGNNLYKAAFQATLNKGAMFMKESVENSQRYIVGCTDKYLKSSITLLEMLTAMDDVSKFTPDQVASLSKTEQNNYFKIKNNAGKASEYIALVLDDLFGDDGVITQSAAYVDRKNTEPTTYVGRGMGNFIKLRNSLNYGTDLAFIEPYNQRLVVPGYDYRWKNNSEKEMRGLDYSDVEKICKHAFKTGYTILDYLTANGFDVDTSAGDKRVLVTGHFDDFRGYEFFEYVSYEGFKGYDISKKYTATAEAGKYNLIQKSTTDLFIPICYEFRVEDKGCYMFFSRA